MREYVQSNSARLASVSLGLAILAVGLVALAGPAAGLYVIAGAPPILIVGGIFAVGVAIPSHRFAAFVLVLTLPLVAGPYLGLLYAARSFGSGWAFVVSALGLSLVAATLVDPVLRGARRREAHA